MFLSLAVSHCEVKIELFCMYSYIKEKKTVKRTETEKNIYKIILDCKTSVSLNLKTKWIRRVGVLPFSTKEEDKKTEAIDRCFVFYGFLWLPRCIGNGSFDLPAQWPLELEEFSQNRKTLVELNERREYISVCVYKRERGGVSVNTCSRRKKNNKKKGKTKGEAAKKEMNLFMYLKELEF